MYLTGIETRLPVSGGHGYDRSNCTLLELKLFSRDEVFKLGICSNCTLLELKLIAPRCPFLVFWCSNCTLLELKLEEAKKGTLKDEF